MKVYLNTGCDDIQIYDQNGEFVSCDCEIFYPFVVEANGERVKIKKEKDLLKLDKDFIGNLIYYKNESGFVLSYQEYLELEF